MMSFGGTVLLMTLLTGGGGSDLLAYIQSDAYWQAKDVTVAVDTMTIELMPAKADDLPALLGALTSGTPAARAAAAAKIKAMGSPVLAQLEKAAAEADQESVPAIQALIDQLGGASKAGAVRRLMAIRTLGELKATSALPVLRPLLTSKTPFEADYAAVAIAAITGIPAKRAGPTAEQRDAEPWMLPAGCAIVGQATMPPGKPLNFAKALTDMAPMLNGQDPHKILRHAMNMLIQTAERVGNVRLDTVTFGVSGDIGDKTGFVAVVARGAYDAEALLAVLQETNGRQSKLKQVDGLTVFRPDDNAAIILSGGDRVVLLIGPKAEMLPVAPMVSILKTGRGGLSPDSEVGKLVKSLDPKLPLWVAAKVTDNYRQAPLLAPFNALTLTAKAQKATDGVSGQYLTLSAYGTDAKTTATAVTQMQGLLDEARAELKGHPHARPILELLNSAKVRADGTNATMTAAIKTGGGAGGMAMLMPFMILTNRNSDHEHMEME